MMEVSIVAKKVLILLLVATTFCEPLLNWAHLEAEAASIQAATSKRQHYNDNDNYNNQQPAQVIKSVPLRLLDCDPASLATSGPSDDLDRCLAIFENIAQPSSYKPDNTIRKTTSSSSSNSNNGDASPLWLLTTSARIPFQQQQLKARRDARSPMGPNAGLHRPPPIVQSGDALSKFLMNGLTEGTGDLSMLDGSDKSLWSGPMTDEIHSRWQPMRGKRLEPRSGD